MSLFTHELNQRQPKIGKRQWVFVPYDQLSDQIGPLSRQQPGSLGVILIENTWKASLRPYHKQRLAFIVTNLRHFALEQAQRGLAIRYMVSNRPYCQTLEPLIAELGPIVTMMPAERELRLDLQPLIDSKGLLILPHEGWLTTTEQFQSARGKSPLWLMDSFYRRVRKDTDILMQAGKPMGGKFSLDAANRLPWHGHPQAPTPPTFETDPITQEVGRLVEDKFKEHPGHLDLEKIPASREDADKLWSWAKRECLEMFGPYEDAMSSLSRGIFHTRISPLLNIHRLLPREIIEDVNKMNLPLSSKEGFIRQVLGWREFVFHVHLQTDGFRLLPSGSPARGQSPGDGGFSRWRGRKWIPPKAPPTFDAGAAPSFLGCQEHLPPAFWGQSSGLTCLDTVVKSVWQEGYSHHITRLMILANLATLLDVCPRELTDWFWVAYTDAYDWVVEPNVLGMGTYALGDLMTTKPYVSGTPYIHKMSDYCQLCSFTPKTNCPISSLYWAFLTRHADMLQANPRMKLVMASAAKWSPSKKDHDQAVFEKSSRILANGERLDPSVFSS
jgi:deoxyribodipyrimidine photolyase-related protein